MYRALYRKWRPQTFSDVSGQPHITATLQNEVLTDRLSHAYLFTGSRGTGKTSCAKILAKAVNCLNPRDGNPCNECEICKGIDSGAILDVTEIDAASNNGVDNIRDLREETNFTPSSSKYRVYIIDEVHMLSAGAFNALLKTLEEPPAYVLFILATTEVHKLPATILSRCQRFDFRRIPAEDIADRLLYVSKHEEIKLQPDAALLIARLSDGALRDALSILDQCAGQTNDVTVPIVSEVAGLLGKDYLFNLSDAINSGNGAGALEIIDTLHSSSCDMERLLSELINHFRNIMIAKTAEKPESLIVCTPDELTRLKEAAKSFTYAALLSISETLCFAADSLRRSTFQRAQTEALLMRLCTPSLSEDTGALMRRLADLEREVKQLKISGGGVHNRQNEKPHEAVIYKPEPIEESDKENEYNEPEPGKDDEPVTEYTVNTEKDYPEEPQEEYETQPEADEQSFEQDEDELPSGNQNGPITDWAEVLRELSQTCKPIYSALVGSTCEVDGGLAVIKPKNNAFEMLIGQEVYSAAVREAIRKITGLQLRPSVFSDNGKSTVSEDDNPLESFIQRVSGGNLDIIVEE